MKNNYMTLTRFHRIISITALGGSHYHHHHFKEKKTGSGRSGDLSKVTKLGSWELGFEPKSQRQAGPEPVHTPETIRICIFQPLLSPHTPSTLVGADYNFQSIFWSLPTSSAQGEEEIWRSNMESSSLTAKLPKLVWLTVMAAAAHGFAKTLTFLPAQLCIKSSRTLG